MYHSHTDAHSLHYLTSLNVPHMHNQDQQDTEARTPKIDYNRLRSRRLAIDAKQSKERITKINDILENLESEECDAEYLKTTIHQFLLEEKDLAKEALAKHAEVAKHYDKPRYESMVASAKEKDTTTDTTGAV